MIKVLLYLFLAFVILGNLSGIFADDQIQLTKVHQSFFHIVDSQVFNIRDSMMSQESKTMLSHEGQLIEIQHFRRIVRFDQNKIYELNLNDSTCSSIDLDKFIELYEKQYEKALKSSQDRAEIENKLLKSRRKTPGGKKLRKYGKWAERFKWSTDTIYVNNHTTTTFGPGTLSQLHLKGVVLDRVDDTIYVERKLTEIPIDSSLVKLGVIMTRLSHFDSPKEWLNWYFTKYHFHGTSGFAEGVQHLVPVGGGFDTTITDLTLPVNDIPVNAVYRIFINERDRTGLLAKGNAISFANQSYIVKTLDQENVFIFDSIKVDFSNTATTDDSLYIVPDGFESQFFPKDNIYRFFETESRIIRKEHLALVM